MTPTNPPSFESSAPFDILIVDDSNALLVHVMNALDRPNYRCRVARTATAAITEMQRRVPDLLLLDCQLDAKRRGSEVLAASPNPSVPVTVVFSASTDEANQMFEKFEQVSARLTKPFSDTQLQQTVRHAIEENLATISAMRKAFASQDATEHEESRESEEFSDGSVEHELPIDSELPPLDQEASDATIAPAQPQEVEEALQAHLTGRPAPLPFPPIGEPSMYSFPAPDEDLLLESVLSHPDFRRGLAVALRASIGAAEPPLICGRPPVVTGAALLQWSVRQSQILSLTMRDHDEVVEIFVAGMRVVGVASDSYAGAQRGVPRAPRQDFDGALQAAAAVHFCVSQTGHFEARELHAPPAWCLMQPPSAVDRLGLLGAG